jgi:hypothetical protein
VTLTFDCGSVPARGDENAEARFRQHVRLFQMMLNSFDLLDRYD